MEIFAYLIVAALLGFYLWSALAPVARRAAQSQMILDALQPVSQRPDEGVDVRVGVMDGRGWDQRDCEGLFHYHSAEQLWVEVATGKPVARNVTHWISEKDFQAARG